MRIKGQDERKEEGKDDEGKEKRAGRGAMEAAGIFWDCRPI